MYANVMLYFYIDIKYAHVYDTYCLSQYRHYLNYAGVHITRC